MNWGTWYWRRRLTEHRHHDWDGVKARRETDGLRERVEVLEDAIRQHMADSDEIGARPRTIDRLLWRTVSEDGLTDEERRYGGC